MKKNTLSRRNFLKASAALAAALTSDRLLRQHIFVRAQDVPSHAPIRILINDSPWLAGFQSLTELYTEATGNEVNLDVTPFAGMLDKSRNAVQAGESEYDILNLNEFYYTQFYDGGLVTPFIEIDPDFELDSSIINYDNAALWNPDLAISTADGDVYGMPINGNIQILFYRRDLFEENGLEPPQTWDEVAAASEALADAGVDGFAVRSQGAAWWEFSSFLVSHGTNIATLDEESGLWRIGLDTDNGLAALDTWLNLIQSYSPRNYANLGQAEIIALMASGRLAQAQLTGASAASFDNPDQSIVTGQMGATVVPGVTPETRSPIVGIWLMSIPANLPTERQTAGLDFLKWATSAEQQLAYARAGAIPVRQDTYEALAEDEATAWWATAFAESTPFLKSGLRIPEAFTIFDLVNLRINEALIGELTPAEAMAAAQMDVVNVMEDAGYSLATS